MRIRIVGFACPKIDQTLRNTLAAAAEFEDPPEVLWINDTHGIAQLGRTSSPTVLIDERLRIMGRVPSVHELSCWIRAEAAKTIEV